MDYETNNVTGSYEPSPAREMTTEEFNELLRKERSNGRGQGVLITLAVIGVICLLLTGIVAGVKSLTGAGSSVIDSDVKDKADLLWSLIDRNFLWEDKVDKEAAVDNIYKGMVNSLGDKYSVYYTKEEFDALNESISGTYSGIGAYVTQDIETGYCYISKPMQGSPAEKAGLSTNDYFYEIDGENVVGLELDIVVSKIKGPRGTTVDIGVKHENQGEIETYTVTRDVIEVQTIEGEMLDDEVGYIYIEEIDEPTLGQLNTQFDDLKSQGMKGLIIDLRDNPGGDLDVVCKMCDKFLDKGIIVYTKDNNGKCDYYKSDESAEKLPIVILVNGNTASAAEIFSGALKDRGVATIIGTQTFGKGIVQSIRQLRDGSGIKLTESEYYLPNDECIHGVGITPDIEIELDKEKYLEDRTDNQKEKAIEVIKGMIK